MYRSRVLAGIAMLLLSTKVSGEPLEEYTITINGETVDLVKRGVIDRDTLWLFSSSTEKKIFVCWENDPPNSGAYKEAVKAAVQSSWEAHSRLKFIGWGACGQTSKAIRILIKDDANDGPAVRAIGRNIADEHPGMILNFDFEHWRPACQQGSRKTWVQRIAVHEFGHAIGFRHEQDRDDTQGTACRAQKTGEDPDIKLTPYDPKSIMNYCYCAANADLSEGDVKSVNIMYPDR